MLVTLDAEYFIRELTRIEPIKLRQISLEDFMSSDIEMGREAKLLIQTYVEKRTVKNNVTLEELLDAIMERQELRNEVLEFCK